MNQDLNEPKYVKHLATQSQAEEARENRKFVIDLILYSLGLIGAGIFGWWIGGR